MSSFRRSTRIITTPRASIARTLTSLTDNSLKNETDDKRFKSNLIIAIDLLEKTVTPEGIRFPDGSLQRTGLDPDRPAAKSLSIKIRNQSRRVEDIISLFLSI